jgi:hypothetical protein
VGGSPTPLARRLRGAPTPPALREEVQVRVCGVVRRVPRPRGVGRGRCHVSGQGAGCAGLAATTLRAGRARLPRTCRVLPEVRAQLRHHRCATHRTAQEGRIRLVGRHGCCVHRAKRGGHRGFGARHAGLLQDVHSQVRRILARLRGGAGPGQPPGGLLQPAYGPPASSSRGIRMRTDRPRPGRSPLEALPLGRRFEVKTDHYSLKYLLDQQLSTIPQHHWVGKLLGFDFTVEYKPGRTNVVADALSRRDTPEAGSVLLLSDPRFDFLDRLRQAHASDSALAALQDAISSGSKSQPWAITDGLVHYDGRLYLPPDSPLLQEVLQAVHVEGHEGVQRTLHQLRREFHFPNMKSVVQDLVRACTVCQRNKPKHLHPAGLLLPLPVPQGVWSDIAMDFIEALPRVRGKSVILTVVDRFSKYAHFIPLAHPYSASRSPSSPTATPCSPPTSGAS